MNSNVKGHKNDLQKSSEYWTVERSKKLLQNGKIHYLYKQHDNVTQEVNVSEIKPFVIYHSSFYFYYEVA